MALRLFRSIGLLALLLGMSRFFAVSARFHQVKSSRIEFSRDVRPILSERCYKCHGPDAAEVKANLQLADPKSSTRDRGGYFAIRPGKPAESMLITRISTDVAEMRMPPEDSGVKPLSKEQQEILRRWIAEGAVYKGHWALIPPVAQAVPKTSNSAWVRNPIDNFVLARLDEAKLKPEPSADRRTLVRRVALTLTGLPPTPPEVQQFLNDSKPQAYERMVDRYLASPRYGEHQARYWLDAVRYGDTHGLHLDNERAIYPYRDWVVRAFNQDLPFEKFATWQLAGDLLKSPTTEQMIATGYVRLNPSTNEGGAIEAEFAAKNTFDRVDTMSTVFLGLTMGCARCHDHKFDPISQADYYRMFAFFNSTRESPLDGNEFAPAPSIRARSPEIDAKIKSWQAEADALANKVSVRAAASWLETAHVELPSDGEWQLSEVFSAANYEAAFATEFGPEPGGAPDPNKWKPMKFVIGKPSEAIIGKDNSAVFVRGMLTSAQERDLELRVNSDDGVKAWLNGKLIHDNNALRGITQGLDKIKAHLVKGRNDLMFKVVNGSGQDGLLLAIGDDVAARINLAYKTFKANPSPTPQFSSDIQRLFLEVGPESSDALKYRKLTGQITETDAVVPLTLIAQELEKPRPAFILRRGEYTLPGQLVERDVPRALGSMPATAPKNRLGLAKWLVDRKNPIVARVFVNRIWQQHFGTGIVKTAEDFGNQGEWPSHPELLDYLSVHFLDHGTSVKDLHRLILNSAAFRQASTTTKEKITVDPDNRLISHGPRFRLDAEVLRDEALFVSGLLKEQVGGKGFKPYQPAGIWESLAFLDSTTSKYMQDKGDTIYRRSLYLFWKRTSPPPMMLTFDAPMRETCVVRRSRTNTPLQALVTMNEPAFFESSRVFAEKLYKTKKSDIDRLNLAYRLTLGREPKKQELDLLTKSVDRYRKHFAKDLAGAESLLAVGDSVRDKAIPAAEQAAWTIILSTIMNTDEFLTQH